MSFDQFANQDPRQIYAQLNPEQRSAIAQQFIQSYQRSGAPQAQQFANLNPNNVSPDRRSPPHASGRESQV